MTAIEVRALTTLEEIEQAVGVQVDTWGPNQLIPREILRAFQDSGNLLEGAFADDRMVGFALAFLGTDEDGTHLHSHLLCVEPDARDGGAGYALKMAQRDWALAHGHRRIRWTFDPMLSRNAHLNLAKLGAIADRFERNFYGEMEDVLNAGDRSDRLFARWDLDRPHAVPDTGSALIVVDRTGEGPPVTVEPDPLVPAIVRIPREYHALRDASPSHARAWRDAVAEAMEACFGQGKHCVGFLPDSAYVLA